MGTRFWRLLNKPLPGWLTLVLLFFAVATATAPTYYGYFQSPGGISTDNIAIPASGISAYKAVFGVGQPAGTDILTLTGVAAQTGNYVNITDSSSANVFKIDHNNVITTDGGTGILVGGDYGSSGNVGLCPNFNGSSCLPAVIVSDQSGSSQVLSSIFKVGNTVWNNAGDSSCGLTLSGTEFKIAATIMFGTDTAGNFCSGGSVNVPSGAIFYQNGVGSAPLGDIEPVQSSGTTTISGTCAATLGTVCALSATPNCGTPIVGCWFTVEDTTTSCAASGCGISPLYGKHSGNWALMGIVNNTGSVLTGDTIVYAATGS